MKDERVKLIKPKSGNYIKIDNNSYHSTSNLGNTVSSYKKISSSSDYSTVLQIEKLYQSLDINSILTQLNPEDNFKEEVFLLLETLNSKLKKEIKANVSLIYIYI